MIAGKARSLVLVVLVVTAAGAWTPLDPSAAVEAAVGDASAQAGGPTMNVTRVSAPSEVGQGSTFTVTATVENTGSARGTAMISFWYDGDDKHSLTVDLAPGEARTVERTLTASGDPGIHEFTVMTRNNSVSRTVLVTDTTAPTAKPWFPTRVPEDQPIQFNAENSTDDTGIRAYGWSFGDGNSANGVAPVHAYTTPGNYSVTLFASDQWGNTDSTTVEITVVDVTDPDAEAGEEKTATPGTTLTFDATRSTDNGAIASYEWSFNGTTKSGAIVGHAFETPGTHAVELTVTDRQGNTDTDTVTVTVEDRRAPTAEAGPNRTVEEGTRVAFDGSESTDNAGIETFSWSFGDGTTAEGPQVEHAYQRPGNYTVTLTVTDAAGNSSSDTALVTVRDESAPTADAGPRRTVSEGQQVGFDGTNSSDNGQIVAYRWQIAGTNRTGPRVSYTFEDPGSYTVVLTVADGGGNTATDRTTVRVNDTTPPTAVTGPNRTIDAGRSVDDGVAVQFDATNSTDNGQIVGYEWSFGDGTTATGPTPTHTYTAPGNYTATLTVTDAAGHTTNATVSVRVAALSVSVASPRPREAGIAVSGADAGMVVTASRSAGPLAGAANLTLSELSVGMAAAGDATFNVSARPNAGSVASLSGSRPVVTAGYLRVQHSVGADAIANATFRFRVAKSFVQEIGGSPDDVTLYRRSGGGWQNVSTDRVAETDEANVYESRAPGLSTFAVGIDRPAVEVTGADLGIESVPPGESVNVTATVENQGSTSQTLALELTINQQPVENRTVTVAGSSTKQVRFSPTFDETGPRQVSVNGVDAGTVIVAGSGATNATNATNSSTTTSGGGGGGGILSLILGLVFLPFEILLFPLSLLPFSWPVSLLVLLVLVGGGFVVYLRLTRGRRYQ